MQNLANNFTQKAVLILVDQKKKKRTHQSYLYFNFTQLFGTKKIILRTRKRNMKSHVQFHAKYCGKNHKEERPECGKEVAWAD